MEPKELTASQISSSSAAKKEIDPLKAYAEACSTIRHYSTVSATIRGAVVVQGLVILTAWAKPIAEKQDNLAIAVALPLGGVLFTWLLHQFHRGYFQATEFFYKAAARMERKFFDEDCRPFENYDREHDTRYRSWWSIWGILNAPFTLIWALCVLALIWDVYLYGFGGLRR